MARYSKKEAWNMQRHVMCVKQASREADKRFGEINAEAARWMIERIKELRKAAGLDHVSK